ncbi:YgfZ/GcvT domain-containing protein [Pseudoxanthomonas jiangsuensis]|uniref:CAF17-like 4Fe-4S cluster assembly/insertion protein YgfZ n=1 Tax=Pseudoxanthomonas jiangsuensis TaxID=619688 RepID=UPI001FEC91C3|nr:folate-binding protein [Pseudoxanthomonas jiangsuensis]
MSPDKIPGNPARNPAEFFALPGYSLLAMDGPDALAFAQAQFASDVTALAIGHWHWSAWLNAKGRVIAVFALLRTGEASLRLLLPDHDAGELGEALRRFVFRRKVAIAPRPDLHAAGAFAVPATASGPVLAGAEDAAAGLELDFGAPGLPRTLRLAATPAAEDLAAAEAWAVADLRLGLPRLAASQRETWTPQQLALDRLPAFSVKKGCYPGQEIVARTHFLGKAKRELLLLQVDDAADAGAEVSQAGKPIGSLASVAGHAPRWALAVLPLERGDEPLTVGGAAVSPQAFVEGLTR